MNFNTVLEEIRAEREYQDGEWGTKFDDNNTLNDWVTYIMIYMGQAAGMEASPEDQRKNMLKAATLAVAAVESFDRNEQFAPRHYEDRVPAGTRPGDDPINMRELTVEEFKKLRQQQPELFYLFDKSDAAQCKPLQDEITIIRIAIEQLLNSAKTDEDLIQRTPSLCVLIQVIERLIRTSVRMFTALKAEESKKYHLQRPSSPQNPL